MNTLDEGMKLFLQDLVNIHVGQDEVIDRQYADWVEAGNRQAREVICGKRDRYYGETAARKYGDIILSKLKGQTVSKRKDTAELPGGIVYVAKKLYMDMWDLLAALEGLCHERKVREIDDSTYLVQ